MLINLKLNNKRRNNKLVFQFLHPLSPPPLFQFSVSLAKSVKKLNCAKISADVISLSLSLSLSLSIFLSLFISFSLSFKVNPSLFSLQKAPFPFHIRQLQILHQCQHVQMLYQNECFIICKNQKNRLLQKLGGGQDYKCSEPQSFLDLFLHSLA